MIVVVPDHTHLLFFTAGKAGRAFQWPTLKSSVVTASVTDVGRRFDSRMVSGKKEFL